MVKTQFTLEAWLADKSQKVVDQDGDTIDPRVCNLNWLMEQQNNLFLVTPEQEELTEFEEECKRLYLEGRADGQDGYTLSDELIKDSAAELLAIARKEIIDSGGMIILESDYDKNIKQALVQGKEEALKDFPRWKKCDAPFDNVNNCGINGDFLIWHGYMIRITDLEKLPKND